jgi:Cdc6-like AAA superfamily ATPase
LELYQKISGVFSPSAPIDQKALFAGRLSQLTDVITAVGQKGQHVILFGERGVGKTSLANVIARLYSIPGSGSAFASINCDSTTDFSALWHRLARQIKVQAGIQQQVGFTGGAITESSTLADLLPASVAPDDVRALLAQFRKLIFIIDELDRLQDPKVTALLSDTIKSLSDHVVDATIILVGVADSVDALIAEHQSIERALVQVRMPRMSKVEIFEILTKALSQIPMTIEAAAQERIASLSQGLPHYTHLLGLHAAQRAVSAGRTVIAAEDVKTAVDKALSQAQQTVVSAYHRATSSPRENLYPQVLLACAMAQTDNLGYFSAPDVRPSMSAIMKRAYDIPAFSQHLNAFCETSRGPILQKAGAQRRFRFRFVNPLMQPYVIMDGLRRGLITHEMLALSASPIGKVKKL